MWNVLFAFCESRSACYQKTSHICTTFPCLVIIDLPVAQALSAQQC